MDIKLMINNDMISHTFSTVGNSEIALNYYSGFEEFLKTVGKSFSEVKVVKPDASRMRSSEVFILARGYKLHG